MDKDGKVGCAYYSAIDETLFLEEDVPLGGLEIAQTLLLGTEPTTVIVSNRSPGHFTELLEANAQRFEDDRTSSGEQGSYILRHFPSTKFNYETAKEALADIEIEPYEPITVVTGSAGADSSLLVHHAKLVRLARLINLENYLAVGCAGAVLYDLERRRAVEDMQTGTAHSAFRIKSLRMNESMDAMLLNADALLSLQIVHPERRRDLLFSDPIKHKDSRSVVALLQAFTSTILGQKRLRQMLLRPTTSLDIIQERQAAIQTFLFPENAEIVGSLRKLLKKLKDPKSLLAKVKKGVGRLRGELCLPLNDWKSLPRFGMLVANVRQSALTVICNEIDVLLFVQMGQRIMQTIDFKVSEDSGHGVIMSGISECLDQLRQELSDLYGMLPEIRDAVAQETPQWADQHIHHCTMMPQFGFLVGVLLDQETGQAAYCGQETTDDEWEFRFQTEEFAYYKNKLLLDLDTEYGDLPVRITEEEIDVVMELSASVMEHEATIIRASELYAELDSLLAMASAAEKYRWVAPQMTTANVIDIVDGRHPIQELRVESSFIPNSCRMRGARWASDLDEPFDDEQGDERAPWDDIRENYSEDELASERGGKANSTMGSSMGSDSGGTPRSEGYAEAQDEITSVWGHEKANEQEIPAETSEMDSEPRSEDSIERETDARRRLRDDTVRVCWRNTRGCGKIHRIAMKRRNSVKKTALSHDGLGDGNNSEEQTVYDGPPSILILTGANNSGKTIYMKQVALIVFLAHTGSFVPAESATIGVTDRILTRLSTRETVLEDESAFLIDIKQAAFAANFATRRSLLLIDEFGKGTNPECGAAIFASFLRNFLEPREYRPKILASTHFHEVFEAGLIGVQEGVAVAHMEVHIDKNAVDIRDQITYLHRLQPGHAKESLAIMCAEMAGIPPRVLDRADDIVELLNANEDITAALPELVEQSRRAHKEAKRVLRGVFLIPEADLEAAQNGDESVDIRAMLENILAEAEDAGFLGDGNLAELGANGMGSGGSKYGSTEDGQMEDSEVENGEMKTGDEMEGVTCSLTSRSAAW
ncbi:putative muts protein 5 [Podospora australis]|uniref:Muts protein 5 n=1 Tax=Podospora australis TaxID=1536484 RepID=A0AAN6X2D4_9PEZI|nr:putative muts protein 5 [Podospora australis]